MKAVYKFIKDNILLIIGGVILIFVFAKGFLNSFINKQSSELFDVKGSVISDNEANQYADVLHTAMGSIGTDFVKIKEVFKNLTEQDFYKVFNKFGDRGYFDWLGVGIDIMYPKMLNLTQWLHSELSSSELKELKVIAPYLKF